VLSLLSACGGGGGGGNTEPSSNDQGSGESLNPGLTGYFIFEWNHRGYLLNAATGKHSQIPQTDWRFQDGLLPDPWAARFSIRPAHNSHDEFLVVADKCDSFSGTFFTCLFFQDYQGNYYEKIIIRDTVMSPRLSLDGKYIAYFRYPCDRPDELEIRDRQGELISEAQLDNNNILWLPGNRIVYVDKRRFGFTYENSAVIEHYLALPDDIVPGGYIGNIAINPQGDQIAFDMCNGAICSIYMMNIEDGTGIRQLARVEEGLSYTGLSHPQWSPDGQWLYVKRGGSAASSADLGAKERMYVVPTQDMGKTFIVAHQDSLRSPEVKEVKRYQWLNNTGSISNVAIESTDMFWVP
jgi:hypothetical protein